MNKKIVTLLALALSLTTHAMPAATPNYRHLLQAVSSKDDNGDKVRELLTKGGNANGTSPLGMPLLFLAARGGKTEVMAALIENGAVVDAPEKTTGITPLHVATRYGHVDAVKLLLEKKANVHLKNNEGQTALDIATQHQLSEIVELLEAADPLE
ncbi:ankyrin repeat domain-containing protein [Candidatus Babeliales bacterium]|nr:ankyrin repeat domain-containing protein [Candidatus Babeliales bacterium]